MNILQITKLLPIIIELIRTVEDLIPGEKKGEQKLAAFRELLETIYGPLDGISETLINGVVSAVVRIFKNNA